jgi:uncharacterized membrane protein YhaH (DUF805 family)
LTFWVTLNCPTVFSVSFRAAKKRIKRHDAYTRGEDNPIEDLFDKTRCIGNSENMEYLKRLVLGRLNRRSFVFGELLYFLLLFLLVNYGNKLSTIPPFLQQILGLATLAVMFSFQISLLSRRLHDLGRDDLTYTFPFFHTRRVSGIFGLFAKSEQKENEYGKPPEPKIDIKALIGLASRSD